MKIEKFEDIESWKESRILVKEIYKLFGNVKDYGFRDQVQRAAISVMSNIAEGFDRNSNKEFIQFLVIARGSVSEIRSLCYAAMDIGYIDEKSFSTISERCFKLSNLINGFIRYLKNTERKA
ncbi:MAG: four helix bundle protein [Syntrophaceae bacterium]|nr:four helix bundle protein [Syntrophaceae bacterium]